MMPTPSASGRVVAAYDIGQGKVRCVIELADRRLTAIDTVADGRGPSPELFRAQPLPDFISFAARCFAGDPRAVSHPKAVLVLATAIVALVAALDPPSPEKDVPVDPR